MSVANPSPSPGNALSVPMRPAATLRLIQAMADTPAAELNGTLQVDGNPGGVFHLAHGSVVAVDSPGAPSVATILLRTGRISEADWAAASGASEAPGEVAAQLAARTLIGPAELQAMCLMTVLDGAFAVTVGRIDDCRLVRDEATPWPKGQDGVEPAGLFGETERRLRALAARRVPVSPYWDRMVRTGLAANSLSGSEPGLRRRILERVNGRRSCRDIAFLLGRGLYAVTMEVAGLLGEELLALSSRAAVPAPQEEPPAERQSGKLPRRRRGASGITDSLPPPEPPPSLRLPFRLRPRNFGREANKPDERSQ